MGVLKDKPGKSLQDLAIEYNLNGEQIIMCQNYVLAMRLNKLKADPQKVMNIINNWDTIELLFDKVHKLAFKMNWK